MTEQKDRAPHQLYDRSKELTNQINVSVASLIVMQCTKRAHVAEGSPALLQVPSDQTECCMQLQGQSQRHK